MIWAILARLGVPAGLRQPLLILGAFAGILAAWAIWLHFHDRRVIRDHEAGLSAQVTAATEAANDRANAAQAVREVENAVAAHITQEVIRNAEQANPEAARAAAGPVSRAAADSLRDRAAKARAAAD